MREGEGMGKRERGKWYMQSPTRTHWEMFEEGEKERAVEGQNSSVHPSIGHKSE